MCLSGGISRLGGEDYTEALLDHLANKYVVSIGDNIRLRVRQQVEGIKRRLGTDEHITAAFSDKQIEVSRSEFREATDELTERLRPVIARALRDADLEADDPR